MLWREKLLDQLAAMVPCGYRHDGPPAAEPTALATIALAQSGRMEESSRALQWLVSLQKDNGSVGPTGDLESPGWPTALAILASTYFDSGGSNDVLGLSQESAVARDNVSNARSALDVDRAAQWLLSIQGSVFEPPSTIGHDSTIAGWPWVLGTHSWIEPTALAVLALKAAGQGNHMRAREGVRMLHNRLMPSGGCNYGNTTVLGQPLLPHLQPTGLALLALCGEADDDGRIARSLDYLEKEINGESAAASLAYSLWALARYGRATERAGEWLAAAAQRRATQDSPLRMALLVLAGFAANIAEEVST